MKIALLCGGPSLERGISLNSARSVLDHLEGDGIEILPVYFDSARSAYKISASQLYSNTPSDFDFKLEQSATPLSSLQLISYLKKADIAFPVMHGPFGEDGQVQKLLEDAGIPYVGSPSAVCKRAFDKYVANEFIADNGFFTLPSAVLKIYGKDNERVIREFFAKHKVSRAVVKPASGGSSIGVFSVSTPEEALEKTNLLFSKRMDTRVVLEPFATGTEFTLIILENRFGMPVSIIPTEIETDYTEHQIFDYRKKYLPTRAVTWHCPPRFDNETIERVQVMGEQLFSLLGMRDFARFDGWVLPDGNIWFCDFNPVSGMEQNSFLFQQASRVGFSHRDVLRYIVKNACRRYGISVPIAPEDAVEEDGRKPVSVLFGGRTSERQVSLMSGTNVWLKLRRSHTYRPIPYLLDAENNAWELPYPMALNHTVEEIVENCKNAGVARERLGYLEKKIHLRLALEGKEAQEKTFESKPVPLGDFVKNSKFVFLALHGGEGEDGTLQKIFAKNGVPFNGCEEEASKLCMDKGKTGDRVAKLAIKGVTTAARASFPSAKFTTMRMNEFKALWRKLCAELSSDTLIVKPRGDGCSSGVVHLYRWEDLPRYADLLKICAPFIPKNTFRNQGEIIEMPLETPEDLLFEKYIETDVVRARGNELKRVKRTGWVEITVGVLEENGAFRVFDPSMTVAEGEVLSVEEKFQGGTGVNITPPPPALVKPEAVRRTKEHIAKLIKGFGLRGYARIDAFMHLKTGDIIVIEINTLPGLTPSTVLFHQALAENPPMYPRDLLEKMIANKGY